MVPVAGMRVGKTAAVTGTVRRIAATTAAKGEATVVTDLETAGRAEPGRAGGPSGLAVRGLATAIAAEAEIVAVVNRGRATADRAAETVVTVQPAEMANAETRPQVVAMPRAMIVREARGIATATGVASGVETIGPRARAAGVRTAPGVTAGRAAAGARAAAMTGAVGGARVPVVTNRTVAVGVTAARAVRITAAADVTAPAAGAAGGATRRAAASPLLAATVEAAAAGVKTAAVATAAPGATVRRGATAGTAARAKAPAATTAEVATAGRVVPPTATAARAGDQAATTAEVATAGRVVPPTATAARAGDQAATTAAGAVTGRAVPPTATAGAVARVREAAATTAAVATARVAGPPPAMGKAAAGVTARVGMTAAMTAPRAGTTRAAVVARTIDDGPRMTTGPAGNAPGSPDGSSVGTVRRRAATAIVATAGRAPVGTRSGAATAIGAVRTTGSPAGGPPDVAARNGGTATIDRAAPPVGPQRQGERRPEMSVKAAGRTRGRTGASATDRPTPVTVG